MQLCRDRGCKAHKALPVLLRKGQQVVKDTQIKLVILCGAGLVRLYGLYIPYLCIIALRGSAIAIMQRLERCRASMEPLRLKRSLNVETLRAVCTFSLRLCVSALKKIQLGSITTTTVIQRERFLWSR